MQRTNKRRSVWMGLILGIGLIMLISAGMTANANPASPFPVDVVQADGSVISIVGRGDEFFNWKEDANGYIVAYDEGSANWCYAHVSGGEIVPGAEVVGARRTGNAQYAPAVRITVDDIAPLLADVDRNAGYEIPATPTVPDAGVDSIPAIDQTKNSQPLLVLLIEYSNQQFSTAYAADPNAYWSNHYFGATGKTVNNYYKEVSGAFNLQYTKPVFTATGTFNNPISGVSSVVISDGVAKVRLNKNHPNSTNSDLVRADVSVAFNAVKGYINFSSVPRTSGYILCQDFTITTVIAGYDASGSSSRPAVWGHASYYYSTISSRRRNLAIDASNMTMMSYATQGEMYSTGVSMPVGVTVHELGHILGLPDLYSDSSSAHDIGVYSLMAYGSWGTDISGDTKYGNTPTHIDAWSKMRLGFTTATTIAPTTYWKNNINSVATGYNVLKITPTMGSKQYFIVENRQLTGYDRGMANAGNSGGAPYGGILIWHIDETPFDVYDRDRGNRANENDGHLGIALEKFPSNPFYVAGSGVFDATSVPNSNFHAAGHDYNYSHNTNCHPQTVASNVQIRINSASGNTMEVEAGPFYPVTSITNVPTGVAVNTPLALTGTVNPSNATNKTITWSVVSSTPPGASITGGTLTTTGAGTVTVRATITNGLGGGSDYTTTFTITVAAPDFTLNRFGTQVFPAATFGYPAQASLGVQVDNAGTVPTGPLTIALSGTNAGDFTLSYTSLASIGVGAGSTFSVVPKTGLNPGTYTATVTVSCAGVVRSFNVSFTVNPSAAKDIIAVLAPGGATISGNTVTGTVGYGVSSLTVNVAVSAGATWKLYSDAACTSEITSKTMALAVGANTAYIKVTAQDGSTKVYTLTVTRKTMASIFPGGTVTLYRKQQYSLFKDAVRDYGSALRFETSGKIKVDGSGNISYNWASIGSATVTAYDAVTGVQVASQSVKVSWQWWQWLLVIFLFGWIYL